MDYKVIRSKRKSLALQVTENGLIVRAPLKMADKMIWDFVESKKEWAETHFAEIQKRKNALESVPRLTEEQLETLAERAKIIIPERVEFFAKRLGVTYGRITIRKQKTRWGSCTSTGNLNFNCLLMLAPPQVLDSVVVHELCHRKEMNHSSAFYREVYKAFPEYDKWHSWLKTNGDKLLLHLK